MRYRLRTLLIMLALGPLVIAWTAPPVIRAVHDWLGSSEPTQEDFDRAVKQLLAETISRSSRRGGHLIHHILSPREISQAVSLGEYNSDVRD